MNAASHDIRRTMISLLAVCAALLPLYLMEPASPALRAVAILLAPVALAVSATAGVLGAACLAVALVLLRVIRPGIDVPRRWMELLVCALVFVLTLGGGSYINEHVVKPFGAVPRLNIALLAAVPSSEEPLLGMTTEAFYGLGDKATRRAHLTVVLSDPDFDEAFGLPDEMKAHWLKETGFAFPSGHSFAAMLITAFFLVLGLGRGGLWQVRLGLLLPLWTWLVGYSRVFLLVHAANDVLFGSLLGLLVGCAAGLVTSVAFRRLDCAG